MSRPKKVSAAAKRLRILPEYIPIIKGFQEKFGPYFPDVAADIHDAAFEWDWLQTRVFMNPKVTVQRTRAKKQIAKMSAALKCMGQHSPNYWMHVYWAIEEAKKKGDPLALPLEKIFLFAIDLEDMKESGVLLPAIKRFVIEAERAIDATPETKNIRWDAVHAIDALRILWWRNTGRAKEAPSKALNPASRFAAYLRDGFEHLEIKADPLSAFRRWSAITPSSDKVV